MNLRTQLAAAAVVALSASACAGGDAGQEDPTSPGDNDARALQSSHAAFPEFYTHPIVEPARCGPGEQGTLGIQNPWHGTVDLSVFLDNPTAKERDAIVEAVTSSPVVAEAYHEDKAHAFRLFQSLFGCSEGLERLIPESIRIELDSSTSLAGAQGLVGRLQTLPGVDEVVTESLAEQE